MNLPMRLLLIAGLLTLCGSFKMATPKPAAPVVKSTSAKTVLYYWYTYPADVYNDHLGIDAETYEWWVFYGTLIGIDTNPIGGTIIARGYNTNVYPHYNFPMEYLYAHFGY